MATPAQITANRLNAQRSTGPRSEEGKAASRFNALKHGIDARSLVIPGEDPAELEALALDYHQQFQPVGPLESYLVETLIQSDWNRRRLTRVQGQLFNSLLSAEGTPADSPLASVFADDAAGPRILDKVHRQLAHAERSYFRALTELRRAQRERQSEESGAAVPARVPPLPAAQPAKPAVFVSKSAPIGFVSPIPPFAAAVPLPA